VLNPYFLNPCSAEPLCSCRSSGPVWRRDRRVPPKTATFSPHENIIIGNVALYGGIKGSAFFPGHGG